jgi:hypothetical protein
VWWVKNASNGVEGGRSLREYERRRRSRGVMWIGERLIVFYASFVKQNGHGMMDGDDVNIGK